MNKKAYHHGNLQIKLIEEGLALIYEQGYENFSLRKLAKRLGVSQTACYNHYSNVEELLSEMKQYVTKKFSNALLEAGKDKEYAMVKMGRAYVNFFAENPHYFSFFYDNEDYFIELTEKNFEGDFEPFKIFKEAGVKYMENMNIEKQKHRDNLIIMWATVHGLAAMANMKGFSYSGDWGELTEKLLFEKIKL